MLLPMRVWIGMGLLGVVCAAAQTGAGPFWRMQDSGVTAGLRGIHAVSERVAWASGTEGTVLRTMDGGAHWLRCSTPDAATDGATLDFRGIQGFDEQTAIVMASGPGVLSRLYKTTDGCISWKLLLRNSDPEGFYDAFHFWTPQHGILLGDPVMKTPCFKEANSLVYHAHPKEKLGFQICPLKRKRFLTLTTMDGGAHWAFVAQIAVIARRARRAMARPLRPVTRHCLCPCKSTTVARHFRSPPHDASGWGLAARAARGYSSECAVMDASAPTIRKSWQRY